MKKTTNETRTPPYLRELPLDELLPSGKAKREADIKRLCPLAKNISQFGVLEPVTVRPLGDRFEIVCGLRRAEAARLAGLRSVPCLVAELSDSGAFAARLSSVVHIDRPDPFVTAELIGRFCTEFRYTEQQAAVLLGLPRKTVADKLRLLRLTKEQRRAMSAAGLTEKHAEIILGEPVSERDRLISVAAERQLSPAELKRFIDSAAEEEKKLRSYRRRARALSDRHLFFNTIEKAVKILRLAGVDIKTERLSRDGFTEYTIRVPEK